MEDVYILNPRIEEAFELHIHDRVMRLFLTRYTSKYEVLNSVHIRSKLTPITKIKEGSDVPHESMDSIYSPKNSDGDDDYPNDLNYYIFSRNQTNHTH